MEPKKYNTVSFPETWQTVVTQQTPITNKMQVRAENKNMRNNPRQSMVNTSPSATHTHLSLSGYSVRDQRFPRGLGRLLLRGEL